MVLCLFLENRRTLISICNGRDLKCMITFHGNSLTADVSVLPGVVVSAHGISTMPASRSSRTTQWFHLSTLLKLTPLNIAIDKSFSAVSFESKHHKWESFITGLNQRFSSAHGCRETLREHSIVHGFVILPDSNQMVAHGEYMCQQNQFFCI